MDFASRREPIVSIAMPALNASAHITEAIASVPLAISSEDVEIVVADGGSHDDTAERARTVARERGLGLRVLPGPDDGIYAGINRAVTASRGRFVFILNSDDRLPSNALERLIAVAGNAAVVSGGATIFGPTSSREVWNHEWCLSERSILFGIATMNARLYRRELFQRLGLFHQEFGIAADREFLLRIVSSQVPRRALSHIVYEYRAHADSRTIAGTPASRLRTHQAHQELTSHCLGKYPDNSAARRALRELQVTTYAKLAALSIVDAAPVGLRVSALAAIRAILAGGTASISGPIRALSWRGYGSGW